MVENVPWVYSQRNETEQCAGAKRPCRLYTPTLNTRVPRIYNRCLDERSELSDSLKKNKLFSSYLFVLGLGVLILGVRRS